MAANDDTNEAYTEGDLISLGQKLAALELTEPERAALGDLISDDDVGGFGRLGIDLVAGIRIGFRAKGTNFGERAGNLGARKPGIRANWDEATGIKKPGRF